MIRSVLNRLTSTALVALLGGAFGLAASGFSPAWAHSELTIVNFGGAQARSHMMALVLPYEQREGIQVDMAEYNGGIDDLRSQVEAAKVRWDAVDMELSDLIRACDEGLLEKINASMLAPGADGTPAADDSVDGAITECGVGSVIWATVFAFKRGTFKDAGSVPSRIADFFDTKTFPGRRGLRRDPRGTLEWALMGDGVAADQVYATLSTPEGVDRAF